MSKWIAKKSRGIYKGEPLYPHKHEDGTYVASTSRFESDYILVNTEDELEALVRSGLGARMSNPSVKQAASLIISKNIKFDESTSRAIEAKDLLAKIGEDADLDIDSISKSRKEQAFLRAHHAKGRVQAQCSLCKCEFPIEFLVAAHIKKRSDCSRSEKLDIDNIAALMCKSGCDDLYEKSYVFVSGGVVKKNVKRRTTAALDSIITNILGNEVSNWCGSSYYYNYHESKCE